MFEPAKERRDWECFARNRFFAPTMLEACCGPALKQAREKLLKGKIDDAELKAIEDREIDRIIKIQEETGLDAVTDGEFRRSWWHLDFLWGLDGVERYVMQTGVAFSGMTTRNEGVRVTGKFDLRGQHPMIGHFEYLAKRTNRTPKMTIPAPSAIYGPPGEAADGA